MDVLAIATSTSSNRPSLFQWPRNRTYRRLLCQHLQDSPFFRSERDVSVCDSKFPCRNSDIHVFDGFMHECPAMHRTFPAIAQVGIGYKVSIFCGGKKPSSSVMGDILLRIALCYCRRASLACVLTCQVPTFRWERCL